jgi:hypothetical protein
VKIFLSAGAAILLPFLLLECTKKSVSPANQVPLIPQKDGPIGPSVAGSTLPLIEARVMRAEYPVGYKPKRTTKTMVALPHLKDDLPAIHAYLNSFPPPAAPTP